MLNEQKIKERAQYRVECLPECIPVNGHAMASGDPEADRQYEHEIIRCLEAGNEWAWCTVKVAASIPGLPFEGADYLGCCTYENEGDFCRNSGYYEDMLEEARTDLMKQLVSAVTILHELEV